MRKAEPSPTLRVQPVGAKRIQRISRIEFCARKERERDIVTALSSPVNFSGFRFAVRLHPVRPAGANSKKELPFELQIPPASLASVSSTNHQLSLDIACAAVGPSKDSTGDKIWQTVGGEMKPDALAAIAKDGILYSNKLIIPSGSVTLHFVVRDNVDGRTGSIVIPYVMQ